MNTSWFTAETAAEETDERISKVIDGTIESNRSCYVTLTDVLLTGLPVPVALA